MNENSLDLQAEELLMRDTIPLPAELAPFFSRVRYFLLLWVVKLMIALQLAYHRIFHPTPNVQPTLVRTYSCRPSLEARVFLPKMRVDGDAAPLPLYITLHGGAFATCDAAIDDSFCKSWCDRTGMIVVGLNYRKAPLHRFPVAVLDVAAVARAVIDDKSLNVDTSRVVVGGFSAGGNLALTATQLPELQGHIRATVAFFPIVDWSAPPHVKFAGRLYTEKARESIATAGPALDWGYVSPGQDRKAKLLSPCFAAPEELPKWVCMVGAQHDMLCREARDMIFRLAKKKIPETGWEEDWEEGTYKWMLVMGVRHGFTDDFRKRRGRSAEARKKICERVYTDIHIWLRDTVLV